MRYYKGGIRREMWGTGITFFRGEINFAKRRFKEWTLRAQGMKFRLECSNLINLN